MIISIVGVMWAIFLCIRTRLVGFNVFSFCYLYDIAGIIIRFSYNISPLSKGKDRLSKIGKDSELLRDLNIYSSWNDQENELHNLGESYDVL